MEQLQMFGRRPSAAMLRRAVRAQRDVWASLPLLALEAMFAEPRDERFAWACRFGYWLIAGSTLAVDCVTGELVTIRDGFAARATDEEVEAQSVHPDRCDADVFHKLLTATVRDWSCGFGELTLPEFRRLSRRVETVRHALGLDVPYRASMRQPLPSFALGS